MGKQIYLTDNQKQKVLELYNEKKFGCDTIARLIGCPSYSPVRRFLQEQGLIRDAKFYHELGQSCHAEFRDRPVYTEGEAIEIKKLFNEGKTVTQIQKLMKMTYYRVNKCMKDLGLKRTAEELKALSISRGSGVSIYG